MNAILTRTGAGKFNELISLRDRLVDEQKRLDRLLRQVEQALAQRPRRRAKSDEELQAHHQAAAPRPSPLDTVKTVAASTADLRLANGNISAERVAKTYGVSLSQLAKWLARSRQTVSKTPDADSLQNALGYFERVARLRLIMKSDGEFRKWLRTPQDVLEKASPMQVLAKGEWQAMADFVDDALTGAPT
jgi:hypothetical protein